MNEKARNKDWVKNVAIIFLVIMLFLTFFSNTIMNRTLPEVATSEAMSGTITAQVRGTGKVTADGSYQVKAPSSREIRAVMVKVGQTVNEGDVLFVLGSGDSEELETAEQKLLDLQTSYAKAAVSSTGADTSALQAQLEKAQRQLAEYQAAYDEAKKAVEESGGTSVYDDLIKETKANLKAANDALSAVYADRDSAEGKQRIADLKAAVTDAQAAVNEATADVEAKQQAVDEAQAYLDSLLAGDTTTDSSSETDTESEADNSGSFDGTTAVGVTPEEIEAARKALQEANNDLFAAKDDLAVANQNLKTAQANLDAENQKVTDAEDAVTEAQKEYDRALSLKSNNNSDFEIAKANLENEKSEIASIEAQISSAEQSAGVSAAQNAIEMQSLAQQIEKQQQVIEELSGGGDNQILAEVAGTVQSISITAGTSAKKGDVIAEIEVPDSGYSLSFTVTNEQAKMLHVGDTASAVNIYWGSTIDATLTSITRDPKNPTTNMVLTFDVSGDVAAGKEVTLTVGSRSASYDLVVPNNAIKSDSNGSFVLAIEEKSSPLGNRYIAKRISVEKLASDDKNTAITADIQSGTFVITTSSKPVSNGKQVKLAD